MDLKKIVAIGCAMFLASPTLWAQGRGHRRGYGASIGLNGNPSIRSVGHRPDWVTSSTADRVSGRRRAAEVGKGKKNGLEKSGPTPPAMNPGSLHSNAPANTPAAAPDLDFGQDRAEEVGQGKKAGLGEGGL